MIGHVKKNKGESMIKKKQAIQETLNSDAQVLPAASDGNPVPDASFEQLDKTGETLEGILTAMRAQVGALGSDPTVNVSLNENKVVSDEYWSAAKTMKQMVDTFYQLHQRKGLDERLNKKLQEKNEESYQIITKLEYLTELDYGGTPLLESEKSEYMTRVDTVSKIFGQPASVTTKDIDTFHDISAFIIRRAQELQHASSAPPSPGDGQQSVHVASQEAQDKEGKKGNNESVPSKHTLANLRKMSQDSIYRLFAGDAIFSLNKTNERQNSQFNEVARAYQHSNEPMVRLVNDLHLDLKGATVLAIACSGDHVGFFSALGAKQMVCFDTSHKATLYSEFKTAAIKSLPFRKYRAFFRISSSDDGSDDSNGSEGAPASDKKNIISNLTYLERVRPNLSDAAQHSFDVLFKDHPKDRTAYKVLSDSRMFRGWGFACPVPQSNLFSQSKTHYDTARKIVLKNSPIFIPGSLSDITDRIETKGAFDAIYVSNAPDHFRDENGEVNPTVKALLPFYAGIDAMLNGKGSRIIFNFQWGNRAVDPSREALKTLGYKLDLTREGYGCGVMACAVKQ